MDIKPAVSGEGSGRDFEIAWASDLAANGAPGLAMRSIGPPGCRPLRLYQAQDGLILGNPQLIGMKRDGPPVIFAESCPYPDVVFNLADNARRALAQEATEILPSACVLDRLWAGNIWHWYMESVPVVAALEEAGFDGCYVVPAGVSLCAESLELLGIPASRIRPGRPVLTAAKSLFFTEPLAGHQLAAWPWLLDWVRTRARRNFPPVPGPRRVYIARRGNSRRVLNEPEILAKLAEHDFVAVHLEDLPLKGQLSLLRDAEIVVGPHGGGLVHVLFMPRGGALIEFFHARYINPCMTPVCDMLGLDYRMVVSPVNPMDNVRKDDLIFVQMELFALALRSALERRFSLPATLP